MPNTQLYHTVTLPKSIDFMVILFMPEPVKSDMLYIDFLFAFFLSGSFYEGLSTSANTAPIGEVSFGI
jgi:hypothetical protein